MEQKDSTGTEKSYIEQRRIQLADKIVEDVFGRRYSGANLRSLEMEADHINLINKWIKSGKDTLVYLGDPGCGKTYLCAALIKYCWPKFESCRYWSERMLLDRLHSAIQQNMDYIKELIYLLDYEFVILDDLGSTGFNDWRKEVLFEAIDYRYSSQKPTLITSNLTREEMTSQLHPRIVSRLFSKENHFIEIRGIDKRAPESQKQA